jgi:hypothetical protein
MKPNIQVLLVLLAALVVAGVLFRQEKEMHQLRSAVAELNSHWREGTAVNSTDTNALPADIEDLRREAAEVPRLRA